MSKGKTSLSQSWSSSEVCPFLILICEVWLTERPEYTVLYHNSKEDFSGSLVIRLSGWAHLPSDGVLPMQSLLWVQQGWWVNFYLCFLIVGNKRHTAGNRDWHPAQPFPKWILFSLDSMAMVILDLWFWQSWLRSNFSVMEEWWLFALVLLSVQSSSSSGNGSGG